MERSGGRLGMGLSAPLDDFFDDGDAPRLLAHSTELSHLPHSRAPEALTGHSSSRFSEKSERRVVGGPIRGHEGGRECAQRARQFFAPYRAGSRSCFTRWTTCKTRWKEEVTRRGRAEEECCSRREGKGMICREVVYGEKEGRRGERSLVVSKLAL